MVHAVGPVGSRSGELNPWPGEDRIGNIPRLKQKWNGAQRAVRDVELLLPRKSQSQRERHRDNQRWRSERNHEFLSHQVVGAPFARRVRVWSVHRFKLSHKFPGRIQTPSTATDAKRRKLWQSVGSGVPRRIGRSKLSRSTIVIRGKLRVGKEARRRARNAAGAPPAEKIIPDKRRKPPKHKKSPLQEQAE